MARADLSGKLELAIGYRATRSGYGELSQEDLVEILSLLTEDGITRKNFEEKVKASEVGEPFAAVSRAVAEFLKGKDKRAVTTREEREGIKKFQPMLLEPKKREAGIFDKGQELVTRLLSKAPMPALFDLYSFLSKKLRRKPLWKPLAASPGAVVGSLGTDAAERAARLYSNLRTSDAPHMKQITSLKKWLKAAKLELTKQSMEGSVVLWEISRDGQPLSKDGVRQLLKIMPESPNLKISPYPVSRKVWGLKIRWEVYLGQIFQNGMPNYKRLLALGDDELTSLLELTEAALQERAKDRRNKALMFCIPGTEVFVGQLNPKKLGWGGPCVVERVSRGRVDVRRISDGLLIKSVSPSILQSLRHKNLGQPAPGRGWVYVSSSRAYWPAEMVLIDGGPHHGKLKAVLDGGSSYRVNQKDMRSKFTMIPRKAVGKYLGDL